MPLDTSLLQAALIGYQHRLAQIEAGRLRQTSEVGNAVHQSATSRHRQLAERTRIDALNDARTLKEVEDLVRELEEASKLFSRRQTEYDTQPMRVFWNIAAATVKGFLSFAAGRGRRSKVQPIAAKVRKPCSELNPGLGPGL